MSFIKRFSLPDNTYTNIFTGVEDTGAYEVIFTGSGNVRLTSNTTDGSNGLSIPSTGLRFVWDSSTPLYLYGATGNGSATTYIVVATKQSTVGLTVSCN